MTLQRGVIMRGMRDACLDDLSVLAAIEAISFDGDRVSRRSFRHLIINGHCRILVDFSGDQIRGYVVILFRHGSSCARIYSIATHPQYLQQGIGTRLIKQAQLAAREKGCVEIRLEIRRDNAASMRAFQKQGYKDFGIYQQYYEDGMEALRFRKILKPVASVSGNARSEKM